MWNTCWVSFILNLWHRNSTAYMLMGGSNILVMTLACNWTFWPKLYVFFPVLTQQQGWRLLLYDPESCSDNQWEREAGFYHRVLGYLCCLLRSHKDSRLRVRVLPLLWKSWDVKEREIVSVASNRSCALFWKGGDLNLLWLSEARSSCVGDHI